MPRLRALSRGSVLYFVGTDHLGGTIRVTDAFFTPQDQMRYYAFGQSRDAGTNLNTDHLYTGQIQDASTGLYWYNARAYDPLIGHFLQPDPTAPDAKNPQDLNRFSYALNNPLKYMDPTGHDVSTGDDGGDGGGYIPPWTAGYAPPYGLFNGEWSLQSYLAAVAAAGQQTIIGSPPTSDPGFIGTQRESWTSTTLGLVGGVVSLGTQPSLQIKPVFGKVVVPDHWEAIPEPTTLANVARIGGIAVGVGFLAADEYSVLSAYNSGTLTSCPDKSTVLYEDAAVIGAAGIAGIVIGLSAPLWVGVAAGIVLAAAVGGARYEIENGDLSFGGFATGAENTFLPLSSLL